MQTIFALKTDLISLILPTDYETQNSWVRKKKKKKGKKLRNIFFGIPELAFIQIIIQ